MSEQEKPNDGGTFEENLRQILSYGPISESGKPSTEASGRSAESVVISPTRRYQDAAEKYQTDQKVIFWFNLLRPVAVVALAALMVLFVLRVIRFEG